MKSRITPQIEGEHDMNPNRKLIVEAMKSEEARLASKVMEQLLMGKSG